MCQLIETIQLRNGQAVALSWHQQRLEQSSKELFGRVTDLDLATLIAPLLQHQAGIVKCRVTYGQTLTSIEYIPYMRTRIKSLRLVAADQLDYHLKYQNRAALNTLYQQRAQCDQVLLLQNNYLTDTTFTNIVLETKGQFITPKIPLLPGTKRAALLAAHQIEAQQIHRTDLATFERIHLINAFLDLGDCVVPTTQVYI